MNADEIVKALREAPNYNAGTGTSTIEDEAADCIEALQAVGSASYWKSAWETQCAENKKLYEALAESQRREQAAVEDITDMEKSLPLGVGCYYCKHYTPAGGDGECGFGCNFDWRGPVAGEGERDGKL